MPQGISRVGKDIAGGEMTLASPNVFINNLPAVLTESPVVSHGIYPHSSATIMGTTTKTFINGVPFVRMGDVASCGDVATGSTDVFAE